MNSKNTVSISDDSLQILTGLQLCSAGQHLFWVLSLASLFCADILHTSRNLICFPFLIPKQKELPLEVQGPLTHSTAKRQYTQKQRNLFEIKPNGDLLPFSLEVSVMWDVNTLAKIRR